MNSRPSDRFVSCSLACMRSAKHNTFVALSIGLRIILDAWEPRRYVGLRMMPRESSDASAARRGRRIFLLKNADLRRARRLRHAGPDKERISLVSRHVFYVPSRRF